MKKRKNIAAFVIGIIAAGLLWQFYLKPKYEIKKGDEDVMQVLKDKDVQALNDETAKIPGELIFSTAQDHAASSGGAARNGSSGKSDVLATASPQPENFNFESKANVPPDFYKQAAMGDKIKETEIDLDNNSIMVTPQTKQSDDASLTAEDVPLPAGQELKDRFTMIKVPVKSDLIKDAAAYNAFKRANPGPYNAKVNFAKEMILFLESASRLSNGFIEIDSSVEQGDKIIVYYRVNIIGTSNRRDVMPYKVLGKSDKKLVLKQIK